MDLLILDFKDDIQEADHAVLPLDTEERYMFNDRYTF
jgi:hypothetical protein